MNMRKIIEKFRDMLQDELLSVVENWQDDTLSGGSLSEDCSEVILLSEKLTDSVLDSLVEACNDQIEAEKGKVALQFTYKDVLRWRPEWSEVEAQDWLSENHDYLTTHMHTMSLGVLCSKIEMTQ